MLPPHSRGRARTAPSLVFLEMGGDIVGANIPTYLGSEICHKDVTAIVVCSESVCALQGALQVLEDYGLSNSANRMIIANLPLQNPEAFVNSTSGLIDNKRIYGVHDSARPPREVGAGNNRKGYAYSINNVLDSIELATILVGRLPLKC